MTVDNPFAASPPPPAVPALPSPPPKPPVPTMVRYNALWGARGESWNPAGQLSDWSYAGYAGGSSMEWGGVEGDGQLWRLHVRVPVGSSMASLGESCPPGAAQCAPPQFMCSCHHTFPNSQRPGDP